MKKLFLSLIMVLVVIGVMGCTSTSNRDIYKLGDIEEMNFDPAVIEDGEIDMISDHPGLVLYLHELKETREELEVIKNDIRLLLEDTQILRDHLRDQAIQLSDDDRDVVIESLRSIHFNRYMFSETIGDAYQQLIDLKENKEAYSEDETKDVLIDVYHVLKARQAIYDTIYDDLSIIHSILLNY